MNNRDHIYRPPPQNNNKKNIDKMYETSFQDTAYQTRKDSGPWETRETKGVSLIW